MLVGKYKIPIYVYLYLSFRNAEFRVTRCVVFHNHGLNLVGSPFTYVGKNLNCKLFIIWVCMHYNHTKYLKWKLVSSLLKDGFYFRRFDHKTVIFISVEKSDVCACNQRLNRKDYTWLARAQTSLFSNFLHWWRSQFCDRNV